MRIPQHPTLLRRQIDSRLKKRSACQPILAAKVHQKTHVVYVPVDLLEEVRSWIAEHRRLKRLLQEISQLSLALVRGHAQARKRRRGRP